MVLLVVEGEEKWLRARERIDLSFGSFLMCRIIDEPSPSSPGGPSFSSSFFSSEL